MNAMYGHDGCNLCGTRQLGGIYSEDPGVGFMCSRCALLDMAGPEMALMPPPRCPAVPDDVDPAIVAIQQNMSPPTVEEYDSWVRTLGNPCKGIEKVREMFTGRKLRRWFESHGALKTDEGDPAILVPRVLEPVVFNILEACAMKHPPSNFHCPGIAMSTAETLVLKFKHLILDIPSPGVGEVVDGILVNHNYCGKCGKKLTTKKACARCRKVSYCDRSCQKGHWKYHKQYCGGGDDEGE